MVGKKLQGLAAMALVTAVAVLGGGLGSARVAMAADTTVVITNDDVVRQPENTPPTNNWVGYFRLLGDYEFVMGPDSPPLGSGSLQLDTPTAADKITVFNFDYAGTALSDIDALSYSTYRTSGTGSQVAALNLQVDANGDAPGGFTTLVFEPVYNTGQGTVQSGEWQEWDAYNGGSGIWWSSNPIPGLPNRDTFVSWNTILAHNPDAVIIGGIGVNQGSGNPALVTAVDALVIGVDGDTTTYDFEVYSVATTREQCKNGGWESVRRADGTSFRNQGDCVSYVNTGR